MVRLERPHEPFIDAVNEDPEIRLGDPGFEDLRVDVGERGGEVGGDHPVARDADDARGGVEGRGERDVRVRVREAGVGGAPGDGGCGGGEGGAVRGIR